MIKEGNLFLISEDTERSNKLMSRVQELQAEGNITITSFTSAKAAEGLTGAIDFLLEFEELFTRRCTTGNTEKLVVVLNNANTLFTKLPNHYKTLLVGYILTAQAIPMYNTEILLAAEYGDTVEEVIFG